MTNKSSRTPREDTQMAVMANDLGYVRKAIDTLNDKIDNNYVTKEELKGVSAEIKLIRTIVYGFVGLILTAVVGGLMGLVLRK